MVDVNCANSEQEFKKLSKSMIDNLDVEKLEQEKLDKEKPDKEELDKEKLDKEKPDKEKLDKEKLDKEKLGKEKLGKEKGWFVPSLFALRLMRPNERPIALPRPTVLSLIAFTRSRSIEKLEAPGFKRNHPTDIIRQRAAVTVIGKQVMLN